MTKARDLANGATALSAVSATELGYLDGVTSAVQTQIDAKQAVVSGVNNTEIGYLDGVTSAIQTQLDAKIPKTLTTTTGDIIYASGANTPARLGIGTTDQVLTVSGGIPTWATAASGGGTWATWTPTWTGVTVGNGTLVSRYITLSNTVFFELKLVFGSTTAITGTVSFSTPATPKNGCASECQVIIEDSGTQIYYGSATLTNTSGVFLDVIKCDSTYAYGGAFTSSVPHTWATNDGFYVRGFFEKA